MPSLLLVTLLVTAGGATAQTSMRRPDAAKGFAELHISKAAMPGQQIRVWAAMMLNPDCSPYGTMTTSIVEQPKHGEVTLSDEPFYPGFVEPNPRAACDSTKALGKQAFYTAAADFHGHDRLILQNATSEGRMRRIIVDVAVP